MKQDLLKTRLIHLATITVLTTSAIGGIDLVTTPTVINAARAKTTDIKVSQKQAIKKFKKEFKNAKVDEITLEAKGSNYQYQIDGFDKDQEHTMVINAKNGKVSWSHSNKRDSDDNYNALDLSKTISRQKANKIAEKAAKKGHGQKWALENDDGSQVWEVEVVGNQTTEVKINALNQQVISSHID